MSRRRIDATIEIRRGLRADLPSSGMQIGEPYFCLDTGEFFVWNGTTMAQIVGVGGGPGNLSGALLLAPTADQTISGSHQLINRGTGQTGPDFSSFDADIQTVAFDPSQEETGLSGQIRIDDGPFSTGLQGVAQGKGAFGIFAVSKTIDSTGTGFGPYGGFLETFFSSTINTTLQARGLGTQVSLSPAVGTTMSGIYNGQQSAIGNVGPGTVETETAFFAEVDNIGGGTVNKGFGFHAGSLVNGATTTAVFHADNQGAGTTNYGILLEGLTHNDLGGGVTKMGSIIESSPSVPPTAASPGVTGQRAWDANFEYRCVAPNVWKRAALSTW